MKKNFLRLIITVVACILLIVSLVGCGSSKTVKQEIYTGEIELSATNIVSVELTLDNYGTFTLTGKDGADLPLGTLGMFGGIYAKNGDNYTFKQLNGKIIATATSADSKILINYYGMLIELSKNEKTVQIDELYGAYKGYINDGVAFELRLILRGDNIWYIIEEDGDIHNYGKYDIEGKLFTAYYHDNPRKICAFGTFDGEIFSLDVEGGTINFQKVSK